MKSRFFTDMSHFFMGSAAGCAATMWPWMKDAEWPYIILCVVLGLVFSYIGFSKEAKEGCHKDAKAT